MRIRTLSHKLCLTALVIISVILGLHSTSAAQICSSGVCVTTWQQDTGVPDISVGGVYRTGENLMESSITASTFNNNGFGRVARPMILAAMPTWMGRSTPSRWS